LVRVPDWVERRDPATDRPELIGYRWLEQLLGRVAPPLHSCQRDYAWIGTRTAEERHTVAASVRETQWCTDNRSKVTPAHVVRYWSSYLDGPRNRAGEVAQVSPLEAAKQKVAAAKSAYLRTPESDPRSGELLEAWKLASAECQAAGALKAVAS
jgi:hypothetical protein